MIGVRPRPAVCAGAVLLSSLAVFGGEARAAPLTVRLEYVTGTGCPDAADFKGSVIARLGYDPFVESAPEQVLVRIEPRERVLDGRIEWRDASGRWAGEQTFPSVTTDCPRLVRTMGFALAVQIQLLARATAAPDANAAAPAATGPSPGDPSASIAAPPVTPVPAAPIVVSAAAPERSPAGAPRRAFAIGAGPAVGFGMSSAPVPLGRLFGVVAWPRVSLELAAVVGLPTTTRRADGAGFSQQPLLGSAAACATAARWSGCVVANAGAVRMSGMIDRPASATVPIAQAGFRAGFMQRLGGRAFVSAHGDGLINLTRWTGRLDQLPVWTAPWFAAALGLDAGVQFP